MVEPPTSLRLTVVNLILSGEVEEAIAHLSEFYHVSTPRIKVGVTRGHCQGVYAVYDPSHSTIYIARGDYLTDPRTVLHEFYHHLRYRGGKHRGTEKYANRFALSFIEPFLARCEAGS